MTCVALLELLPQFLGGWSRCGAAGYFAPVRAGGIAGLRTSIERRRCTTAQRIRASCRHVQPHATAPCLCHVYLLQGKLESESTIFLFVDIGGDLSLQWGFPGSFPGVHFPRGKDLESDCLPVQLLDSQFSSYGCVCPGDATARYGGALRAQSIKHSETTDIGLPEAWHVLARVPLIVQPCALLRSQGLWFFRVSQRPFIGLRYLVIKSRQRGIGADRFFHEGRRFRTIEARSVYCRICHQATEI